MKARTAAVALVFSLILSAACGSDEPALSERATQRLQAQVAAIEYAIAGRNYRAAREGLGEVRATTVRLTDAGDIESSRTPEILDAVEELDLLLVRLEASP